MSNHMRKTSYIMPILRLSIPLIIGQMGIIVQQFADTAMVGHYGTDSLSAAGFVSTIFNIVTFFLLGIAYSTTPVAGACFGRGDMEGTSRTLRESLTVGLITTVAVMLPLTWLYMHLEVMRQPAHLLPLARPYFLTLLLSLPFVTVFNTLKQFADALGHTRQSMWVMLASNVINILLNVLLIFGLRPLHIPALGLLGAGLATLVSRIFMAIAMAAILWGGKRFHMAVSSPSRISWSGLRHMWTIGLPISLQLCLETASFNVCGIFMGWIGASAIAAHQVMSTIAMLCFMVVYGIGAAGAILVSQHSGQGKWHEVERIAYTTYGIGMVCIIAITTAIIVNVGPLTGFFTTSHEVQAVVVTLLVPFIFYQAGDCLQITFANVLRGMARVRSMMVHAFVAYIVVSIPLSYLFAFPLHAGAKGIWWGFPFGLTTAGLLFYWEFRKAMAKYTSRS